MEKKTIGSVFSLTAIVCQIAFLVFGLLSVKDEEWSSPALANCKCSMILWSETIISSVILLFAATLPLAGNSHKTVSFRIWLFKGIPCILASAIICFLACLIVNLPQFRLTKSSGERLQLVFSGTLSLLLIGLLIGHNALNIYLQNNLQNYGPYKEFNSLHAFKKYMETPKSTDGNHLSGSGDYDVATNTYRYYCNEPPEEYILHADNVIKSIFEGKTPEKYPSSATVIPAPDYFTAEYGYVFRHLNRNVVHYVISENEEHLPIYAFTAEQYDEAMQIVQDTSIRYTLTYLIVILISTAVYLPLRKRYA